MERLLFGNNIKELSNFSDNYFDAIVTDPPYGLGKEPNAEDVMQDWISKGYHEVSGKGFMGKEWDSFVPQPIFWKEVFRVLKPGGHVLSFYGTRTYDWGVMAMRFAGFEIRDCIEWVYGSGFPKSHNIGKAIDKMQGNEREIVGEQSSGKILRASGQNERPYQDGKDRFSFDVTKGSSEYEGWGTALKPAHEPIVLARKPIEKGLSVAENMLKWGVGGINIDKSRVEVDGTDLTNGRFPANLIHDNSEGVRECFPVSKGAMAPVKSGQKGESKGVYGDYAEKGDDGASFHGDQTGNASRFFKSIIYVPKASASERSKGCDNMEEKTAGTLNFRNPSATDRSEDAPSVDAMGGTTKPKTNFHPTVKPVALMQYLVSMITPKGGTVLDPYMGSGTTGVAAVMEGFDFVGIEMDEGYMKIAEARIGSSRIEIDKPLFVEPEVKLQLTLF